MGVLGRIGRALVGPSIEEMAESPLLKRDAEPLEGTNMSLFNSAIPGFWTENGFNDAGKAFWPGDGRLAERVWITNRCIQMNAQQIGSMPLRFKAPNVAADGEPAWISNPDPLNYPNGISSIVKALVADYYGWGYALVWITARYADGYPRNWTRIPAGYCTPRWASAGYREYRVGDLELDPADIIQIDRDDGCYGEPHGSSAIRSYAQLAWGLLAAGNLAMDVNQGGIPKAVLKVTDENRKLSEKQAGSLQTQWMEKTQRRNGAPPVLPPGLDFETLSWNPKDMALLETQDFNALALATAFGIPAVLVNMTVGGGRGNSSLTYQNPAMLGETWWRFELRPTAKAFADAFTAQALPGGQWVWFDAKDTFLEIEPQNTAQAGGPLDNVEDDTQEANTFVDESNLPQQQPPAVASASPAQKSGAPRLTSIGGSR